MKPLKFLVLIFLVSTVILSCAKEKPDCYAIEPILFSDLNAATSTLSFNNMDDNFAPVKFIIKDQQNYEKHIKSSATLPIIDFSKYTLLCGRYPLSTCGQVKNQETEAQCSTINYTVTIERLLCQAPQNVYHFALLPSSYSTDKVNFEYKIIN